MPWKSLYKYLWFPEKAFIQARKPCVFARVFYLYLWIKRIEDILVIVEVNGSVFVHQFRLIFMFLHTEYL